MHITQEGRQLHTITAYDSTQITVNQTHYSQSIIIHAEGIIPAWPVRSSKDIDIATLQPLLATAPNIIIIGQQHPDTRLAMHILQLLQPQQIGIECMDIGAACRTFNVLLSENRRVTLGLIFSLPEI